jgi:CO/xanthine dehydrogenase Mo-binding subunit
MKTYTIIGQPVRRVDGFEKVSGLIRYGVDMSAPGMLWARTLRSPHPHARLVAIDTRPAKALPGVEAVVTAADIRGTNRHGIERPDQPVLVPVGERVKMIGDPVAAVAARTKEIAEEALRLIEVKYEPLPGVFSPEEALAPGAPQLHDDAPGNLVSQYSSSRGDVVQGFAEADAIVEGTFILPRQEQAYLEVEGGLATIDSQGVITVYAGSQRPVFIRKSIHHALGFPEHKVRSISAATGGGFGGKADLSMHGLAALLAHKTRKPVKLVWSREESFLMHPKRHPFWIRARLGAKRDGTFTALEAEMIADSGAYASHSLIVVFAACSYLPGPYDIPHLKISGRSVYTNNPISGACRGYGQPQAVTPLESLIDWLAHDLGIDPAEIRLKNALEWGDTPGCPRVVLDTPPTLPLTLREALAAVGEMPSPSGPGKKTGRGLGCAMPIFDISTKDVEDMKGVGASVEIFPDGTALVRSGVCEIGAGLSTVLAQVAAEELGLRLDQVSVLCGNTESTPDAGPTVASRQAYCSGNAVRLAAADVRSRILEVASDILHAGEDHLELANGMVRVRGDGHAIPLSEVTKVCHRTGVNLLGSAWFSGSHAPAGHTFMTTVADVEVDEETGQVRVLKIVTAHDVGQALNPLNVTGQLIGAAAWGVGYALCEEMPTREGRLLTPTLTEYLTPMSLDGAEEWQAVIVEDPYPTGPYGAKGVGEHGTNTTPVAILNAIFHATGARVTEMPATPERLLRALKQPRTPGS